MKSVARIPIVAMTFSLLIGLAASSRADAKQWHLAFLRVAEANAVSQGEGVIVAVIDTGVDASHPDLRGSILSGTDVVEPAHSTDGRVDVVGHGTAMAGLIVGHGQVVGIAPKAKLLPVRAFTDVFGTSEFPGNVAKAIDWSISHGARIISVSGGATLASDAESAAIARAIASDVLVVGAAGNVPDYSGIIYPAAYPGVVSVVGVDRQGIHARISVSGSEAVIAAPAVDIFSTDTRRNGIAGYSLGDGTSGAAAIVSGVAALVRSKFPKMSAAEVVRRLTATADDKGPPGRDPEYGYGIVDPVKALTADLPSPTPSATPSSVADGGPGGQSSGGVPWWWLGAGGVVAVVVVAVAVWRRRRPAVG